MVKKLYLDILMKKIPNFLKKCKKLGLKLSQIKKIENSVKKVGGNLFIIGGNVRDLVLEKKISSNPDLVCDLPIQLVIKSLNKSKFSISKVGLKFNSIVIKINDVYLDLTSMRKDLTTDGRWATTQYTKEIFEDARRRDFTINAIYCDTHGKIFDPFNGIKDLMNSKVKFIGPSEERVKEDFLRILRFLRFSYNYSSSLDKEGLKACKKLIKNIKTLSFERRIQELKKILLLEKVGNKKIIDSLSPFIAVSIGCEIDTTRFDFFCNLERSLGDISFERRLKFLIRKSKISNLEILDRINKKTKNRILSKINIPKKSRKRLNSLLYNNQKILIFDQLIEDFSDKKISKKNFEEFVRLNQMFKKTKFPIDGTDLTKIGVKKNATMGKVLEKVKNWWIQNDFKPKKKECEKYAKSLFTNL